MAITDKTRKTLWARSGNRCAMCRKELVSDRNEHDKNLNLGDECHIISSQPNGPRHDSEYKQDYDDYPNLILLCKNDHRTIDELFETYTVDLLKTIKNNHEKWIKTTLENAEKKDSQKGPKIIGRITEGKDIVDIIYEVAGYEFDHEPLKTPEETDLVSAFLQNLSDWGDLIGMGAIDKAGQVKLGYDLNTEIQQLENMGFFVFGEKRKTRMVSGDGKDLGKWDIATILVIRKENPSIINFDSIAVARKS